MPFYAYIILVVLAYLFGNISNAKIISKLKHDDITKHGSGNPGTMNMLRTFGFKIGLLTLFLDALKGAIPSLVGYFVFGKLGSGADIAYIGLYVGGMSAIFGHCFPVFYKFKGGKGVATMLGMFAVAEPYYALIMFAVCFLYLIIFDYGAMASFLFITVLTLIEGYKFHNNLTLCIILFCAFTLVFYMHRKNITRLLVGKENKINFIDKLKKIGKKKSELKTLSKEERKEAKKELKQEKKEKLEEEKEREIG